MGCGCPLGIDIVLGALELYLGCGCPLGIDIVLGALELYLGCGCPLGIDIVLGALELYLGCGGPLLSGLHPSYKLHPTKTVLGMFEMVKPYVMATSQLNYPFYGCMVEGVI